MQSSTPEAWYELAEHLYKLTVSEIDRAMETDVDLPMIYPKLIICYQFFRQIRGEGFHTERPDGMGEWQKQIYAWEDDLWNRIVKLRNKLNPEDNKTNSYINEMKNVFNLK
ncbi:MAG: hypothetical protein AAB351_03725 [Patescibacteria group bacterium]|mgnify:CR=1 FL=1